MTQAPDVPDAGVAIILPEFGQTLPELGDTVLTDPKGQTLPVARIWRGEGQQALLLAQGLTPGREVHVYFGGGRVRHVATWLPKTSLLLETRRFDGGPTAKMDSWQEFENAWKKAGEVDGAGFVPSINHGENPFGENENFLSHYSGWLKTDGKRVTLYTLSSDASFVLVGEHYEFGWPGKHGPRATAKDAQRKEIGTNTGLTRIDYYQAKFGDAPPAMVLGWNTGGMQTIPASAWAHPGAAQLERIEQIDGWPLPIPTVQLRSYIGWNGLWMYDAHCALDGGVPAGWSVSWEFDDGAKRAGETCDRVLFGNALTRVVAHLQRNQEQEAGVKRVDFKANVPQVTTAEPEAVSRYVSLLEGEDPAQLASGTLRGGFEFLDQFGSDQAVGKFAAAWLQKNSNQDDPLWIRGQLARLRTLAQTDPQQALKEVRKFDSATRKKFSKELGMEELDIMVFYLKDPASVALAQQLSFQNADNEVGRLAKIRVGDLYRLQGKAKEALAQYQSVQKTVVDDSEGRKFGAQDRGYSIAIADLISQGYRHEAEAKLTEWELDHPTAKFDSDFLLLRGRVLMEFGRWNEALQEIDSFRAMNPDSPYQIPADFYRARALYELGRKDEARRIWKEIATRYPKHDLAKKSAEWAAKP
ncbi:MAG TPA: tetratricopeptide repeat protein [Chthoniobacter sp.]